ncbi:trypsin-like peptidase domain-containing protein [Methylobacterium sp. BTF04]|uniref:S1 family peptidase n=1 Tax=Methylobacterium sp. BTF04 TaxID=2708300 RepID=UPI0013D2DAE7|nr:serine protease [Methylobacterium sp. BTF04]NEU14049.1 trypsin-like peptidase domain-containing protein [Methylobacterium sp. BTF04]
MSFPAEPESGAIESDGLFLVQDPELRSKILPLFSFDPQQPDNRPRGEGTTFRIDPWSRCVTAYHVLENLFEADRTGTQAILRPDLRLVALELQGLAIGTPPIAADAWRPLSGCHAQIAVETPPLGIPRLRNLTELVVLRIHASKSSEHRTPYLPLDLRRWWPRPGERVLALGYAGLDKTEGRDDRPISQYMYGSFGKITDIELADGGRGRPWPIFRVAADWPGGMSGGPVFNEAGHVVGVVSSGIAGGVGTATFFAGWNLPAQMMGSIDPSNPGLFFCVGVFDLGGQLVCIGQDLAEAQQWAASHQMFDIARIAYNPCNGDYIRA